MTENKRDKHESAERAESAIAERRDAGIEQLERALADEREYSAALRAKAEELRFRNEILEKSYAKQLDDARAEIRSGNEVRDEQAERIASLDAARIDAIGLLEQAKVEIDRLTTERERLRRRLLGADAENTEGPGLDADFDPDECSIDELMDDASWLRRRAPSPAKGEPGRSNDPPESAADMLDPGLYLAADPTEDQS